MAFQVRDKAGNLRYGGQWSIKYDAPDGTERREVVKGTEKDADEKRVVIRAAIKAGTWVDPREVRRTSKAGEFKTFSDICGAYAKYYASRSMRTTRNLAAALKHLLVGVKGAVPLLPASTAIAELTPARLRRSRDTLAARPGSIATKNMWLTYLCMICRWAAKNPAIPLAANPAEGLERFREHGTRGGDGMNRSVTRDEVFNDADMEAMVAYRDKRSDASTSIMLRTAFGTGLRKGEIAGLRWADVDFERRTAHVCRTYDRRGTKSGENRSVPLPVALVTALRAWKASSPYKRDHHPCFPTEDGEHRGECWGWSETVKRVALGAGVARPGMRRWGHLTRHSYATSFLLKGGPAALLARILGHAGTDLIFKTYAHIGETDLLDAIDRIGLGEVHQKATVTELNRVKSMGEAKESEGAIG